MPRDDLVLDKSGQALKNIRREAEIGRKRRVLLPVLFGSGSIPWRYKNINFADLSGWSDHIGDPALGKLVGGLEASLNRPLRSYLQELAGGHSMDAVAALRSHLVDIARRRAPPITYDEAKRLIARAYKEGEKTPDRTLFGTLDAIATQNRQSREPPLFGLVVLPDTAIPGRGYFQKHCFIQDHQSALAAQLFQSQLQAIYDYSWPKDP